MAGNIILPIFSTFNASGVRQAQQSLGGLSGAVSSLGKSMASAAKGFIAFQATSMLVNFAVGTITQARDLQRNIQSLGIIFKDATPQMEAFARSANSIGLSTSQAAQASTFLGSVLKGAGFDTARTAQETQKLVGLASDLATVYGYDVSEALTGITALFRGEYDPIEKFGVAIKQQQVNAVLAAKGLGHLTGVELLNAQQQVRLELLYARTAAAQGAFAKGSGTLFVAQKKLESAFIDFQATLGQKLTPVLTEYMQKLLPMLNMSSAPAGNFFQGIADSMKAIMPLLAPIGNLFGIILNVVGQLMMALAPLIETLSGSLANVLMALMPVFQFLADIIGGVATAAGSALSIALDTLAISLRIILGLLTSFMSIFSPIIDPIMGFLGAVVGGLKDMASGLHGVANLVLGTDTTSIAPSDETSRLTRQRLDRLGVYMTGDNSGQQQQQQKAKNYVKDFYSSISDEIAKQNARLKLSGLGASEALINSIVSGDGWKKVYTDIIAGGAAGVAKLQEQFNKTKTGADELAASAKQAADELAAWEQAMSDMADQISTFNKGMNDLLKALSPLPLVSRTFGEFESAVVDAFDAITNSLTDAVDNKLLFQSSADDLAAFAKNTKTTLAGIARQRDEIAKRIADANDLIASTKNAVIGFGNITSLLESQSQTIVETTTSVVDGIRLTLTKSLDVQGLVGDLTANFQKVLDKTKKFAADLKELRRLGLDKNLFKQIVDAGVESGGATAAAIIAGGSATVSELNSVFADLDMVGADIAEQTAQVMFGAGVDITNGLIAGLMAQDNALMGAAQALADAFTSTFNARMTDFMNSDAYKMAGLFSPNLGGVAESINVGGGSIATGNDLAFRAASVGRGTVYEININAGMVTDKAELGQTIVDSITRYERTNGSVWQRV
jgi:hypothetical protein